ncbi:MAG: hypothetical protein AABX38_03980 [Candidatus Micrarchaeota archaeon]
MAALPPLHLDKLITNYFSQIILASIQREYRARSNEPDNSSLTVQLAVERATQWKNEWSRQQIVYNKYKHLTLEKRSKIIIYNNPYNNSIIINFIHLRTNSYDRTNISRY